MSSRFQHRQTIDLGMSEYPGDRPPSLSPLILLSASQKHAPAALHKVFVEVLLGVLACPCQYTDNRPKLNLHVSTITYNANRMQGF